LVPFIQSVQRLTATNLGQCIFEAMFEEANFVHPQNHFIHAHTAHVAEIRSGIGGVHLPEKHPPQPGVRLANGCGHLAHGHLAHEQQGKGFKLFGEVRAQALPRRAHSENVAALAAFTAR
jgi:hypothetical protein